MPGLAPDTPDRITDIHREASAPSSPPHEANQVALEERLEGTRITRKGHPPPGVAPIGKAPLEPLKEASLKH